MKVVTGSPALLPPDGLIFASPCLPRLVAVGGEPRVVAVGATLLLDVSHQRSESPVPLIERRCARTREGWTVQLAPYANGVEIVLHGSVRESGAGDEEGGGGEIVEKQQQVDTSPSRRSSLVRFAGGALRTARWLRLSVEANQGGVSTTVALRVWSASGVGSTALFELEGQVVLTTIIPPERADLRLGGNGARGLVADVSIVEGSAAAAPGADVAVVSPPPPPPWPAPRHLVPCTTAKPFKSIAEAKRFRDALLISHSRQEKSVSEVFEDRAQVVGGVNDDPSAAWIWCLLRSHTPLIGRQRRRRREKELVVCHDCGATVYRDDAHAQGLDGKAHSYILRHWAHIDLFIYFSHARVTLPPAGWIDAGHRHGVPVLGTLIYEWDSAVADLEDTVADPKGNAWLLAHIAAWFGFDGWLLNIECAVTPSIAEQVRVFATELRKAVRATVPRGNGEVVWYDSIVHETGELRWQSCLNEKNAPFFHAVGNIFCDYHWDEDAPSASAAAAGEGRGRDVMMGVDVFGRGTWGGGGYGSARGVAKAFEAGLSAALFAPAWTFETGNGISDEAAFERQDDRLWLGVESIDLLEHGVWQTVEAGGDGWKIEGGIDSHGPGVTGDQFEGGFSGVHTASYGWCRKRCVVNVERGKGEGDGTAAGGSGNVGKNHITTAADHADLATLLADEPEIELSVWVKGVPPNTADPYYISLRILSEDGEELAAFDTGERVAGAYWTKLAHVFEKGWAEHSRDGMLKSPRNPLRPPPRASRIVWEHGGKDAEFWAGHFGASFKNPRLIVRQHLAGEGVVAVVGSRPLPCDLPFSSTFSDGLARRGVWVDGIKRSNTPSVHLEWTEPQPLMVAPDGVQTTLRLTKSRDAAWDGVCCLALEWKPSAPALGSSDGSSATDGGCVGATLPLFELDIGDSRSISESYVVEMVLRGHGCAFVRPDLFLVQDASEMGVEGRDRSAAARFDSCAVGPIKELTDGWVKRSWRFGALVDLSSPEHAPADENISECTESISSSVTLRLDVGVTSNVQSCAAVVETEREVEMSGSGPPGDVQTRSRVVHEGYDELSGQPSVGTDDSGRTWTKIKEDVARVEIGLVVVRDSTDTSEPDPPFFAPACIKATVCWGVDGVADPEAARLVLNLHQEGEAVVANECIKSAELGSMVDSGDRPLARCQLPDFHHINIWRGETWIGRCHGRTFLADVSRRVDGQGSGSGKEGGDLYIMQRVNNHRIAQPLEECPRIWFPTSGETVEQK